MVAHFGHGEISHGKKKVAFRMDTCHCCFNHHFLIFFESFFGVVTGIGLGILGDPRSFWSKWASFPGPKPPKFSKKSQIALVFFAVFVGYKLHPSLFHSQSGKMVASNP